MMSVPWKQLLTVPRFERIPCLYHGFGNAFFEAEDFSRREEWRDFRLLFLDQIHSDVVHFIQKVPEKNLRGDALVTDLPRIFLIIKTADCLPIFLVDEARRVIAAVHCGWKGTLEKVLGKVVLGMKCHYGSDPESLLAAFGPSIGGECYEVGEDVARSFAVRGFPDSFFRPVPSRSGKYLFDLREANRIQLLRLGVKEENLSTAGVCTHCDRDFLSFRRDKSRAGRMLSFIAMSG
jgi:YfiH family protein